MLRRGIVISINFPFDGQEEVINECEEHIVGGNEYINKKKHKVFSVPKANAVVDPRTVMVHVQHTPIAC